jgi:hypothetical protein
MKRPDGWSGVPAAAVAAFIGGILVVAVVAVVHLASTQSHGTAASSQSANSVPSSEKPSRTPHDPSAPAASTKRVTRPAPAPPTHRLSLAVVCNLPTVTTIYICGPDEGDTVEVGGVLFQYYGENNGFANAAPPYWSVIVGVKASTCESLTIRFAVADTLAGPGSVANLQIIRSGAPPVEARAPRGHVGALSAKISGSFVIQANSTDGSQVFADGYAICRTESGT